MFAENIKLKNSKFFEVALPKNIIKTQELKFTLKIDEEYEIISQEHEIFADNYKFSVNGQQQNPPNVKVYKGYVKNKENSNINFILVDEKIKGVLSIEDKVFEIIPFQNKQASIVVNINNIDEDLDLKIGCGCETSYADRKGVLFGGGNCKLLKLGGSQDILYGRGYNYESYLVPGTHLEGNLGTWNRLSGVYNRTDCWPYQRQNSKVFYLANYDIEYNFKNSIQEATLTLAGKPYNSIQTDEDTSEIGFIARHSEGENNSYYLGKIKFSGAEPISAILRASGPTYLSMEIGKVVNGGEYKVLAKKISQFKTEDILRFSVVDNNLKLYWGSDSISVEVSPDISSSLYLGGICGIYSKDCKIWIDYPTPSKTNIGTFIKNYRACTPSLLDPTLCCDVNKVKKSIQVNIIANKAYYNLNQKDLSKCVSDISLIISTVNSFYSSANIIVLVGSIDIVTEPSNYDNLIDLIGIPSLPGGPTHLFMGESNPVVVPNVGSNIIGLANMGPPVCGLTAWNRLGYRRSLNASLVAHELGHNFGAPHSYQGGIMAPAVGATFFSADSISDITTGVSLSERCILYIESTPGPPVVSTPIPTPTPTPTPTPAFVGKILANISLPTTSSYSIYLDLDETRDVLYVGTRSAIVNNTGVGGIHAISCVNDQVLRTTSFNGQGLWDTGIAVNPITQKVYGMGWPITNGVFNASTNRNLLVVNSLNGSNINSVVVGPYGRDIAINRSLNRIYVINNSKVGVFNGTNDSKISDISFGETSIISIAINENTSKGYVTTYTGNILYVFDTNTLRIIKTIQIGSGGQTRLFNLRGVAIDKIKNKIYVVNTLNYLGPGDQLPWRSSVSVIDGTTDTLSSTIEIPLATDRREVFNGIDVNPITNRLYVSGLYYGTIKVINTLTNTIEGSLEVGDGLYDICVNSNLNKVYASKYSGGIVVVDTKQEIKPTATPPGFTSQPTPTPTKTPAPTPAPTEPIYRVIKEIPLSGSVPYVDLDRNTGILYAGVAHSGFGEVAAINCNNDVGEVLRNTRFENVISGLTLNQTTNKIYVTTSGNNLVVIKGSTGETLRTLSTGQSPGNVGVENIIQGSPVVYTYPRIYVPSTASQYISVLEDRESSGGFETEITRIPRTVRPVNVEINEKLGKGYITDLYSDQLMIFNTSNPSLNSIINIKSNSIFPTFFTRKIAINRINNLVYVVNNSALSVSVVDGITNQILFEINLATPGVTGARLSGMAISPNTNKLFVSERKSNSIYIIDTITNTKIGSVVVGGSPYDLVLRPGVGRMYVGHSSGVSVVSIDSPFVPTPTPTNTPTPTVTPALENLGRGRTRIYSWNGSSWIKMNPNIVGNEGGDQSGHSVSISKNGEFVAIGAPYNRSLSSPSRVGQVRVYQSLCETIPTPTPTASSQLTWGPLVDQTAEWELPAEDLFWNFRNLYNFRVVKMELPGTTFTYPYRAWFFGYSVADFNPDLVSPQIDDSPYVNDAIFYARSTGLKSGWQVYCGKDANGNNVWDTTMNPALWKPVVYRSAYQNTLSYDSEVAGDPAVVYYQGTFYMAYSASGRKIVGNDTYFIACIMGATSTNGIDWVKSSAPILEWPLERTISLPAVRPGYWTPANYYGAYHRPSLMLDEGKWKMWFDYFTPDATKWLCLGYAENTVITDFLNGNLTTPAAGQTKWQVLYADTNWLMENWPNPSVVKIGNTYYAFCDASNRSDPGSAANPGTHLGGDGRITVVAQSPDGINWTKTGFILPDGLDCANVGEAFVHTENGQVWLYLFYAWKPRTTQNPKPVDWYQYKKVKYTRKLIGPNSTPTPTATIPGFTQPPTPTPTPSRTPGPTRTPTPTPTPIPILKNYSRSTTDDVNHTNWGLLRMILDSNLTDWGEP